MNHAMIQNYIDLNKDTHPELCEIMELMLAEIQKLSNRVSSLEDMGEGSDV